VTNGVGQKSTGQRKKKKKYYDKKKPDLRGGK